ncbi:MAG: T9SS type A sorting domain-containing protein [Gemmatimonadota bacterium]|nr:MAG: T9SS type A sorting domain-containing protein [Gemmatimonadota bacterium]
MNDKIIGKIPRNISLFSDYPNPFNPSTTIEFNLPKTSKVTLKIFNILGEEVTTLVSEKLSTGSYIYEWDASNLASGVYLYRLEAEGFVETKKMMLMK